MAREPAPDVKITEGIMPAAQLHDTYWRPANPEPSPLHAVARSLAALSDDISSTFARMDAQQAENMRGQGELAFYTGGMTGQGGPSTEAMGNGYRVTMGGQEGGLPLFNGPKASSMFRREVASAEGYAQGFAMQGRIAEKYAQLDSETKFNMTPEQIDAWVLNEIRNDPAAVAGLKNPAMARGLAPQMREIHTKINDQWRKEATENAKTTAVNTWGKTLTGTLEQATIAGRTREGGTDYAQVTADLNAIRTAGFKVGLTEDQVDKLTASSIIERAKLERDPKLLEVLGSLKDKDGKPVALNMDVAKAKTEATEAIHGLKIRDENEEFTRGQRRKKEAHDGALRKVTDALEKDPNAALDEKDLSLIEAWAPGFKKDLIEMRKTMGSEAARLGVEDPLVVQNALRDIYSGKNGWDVLRQAAPNIKSAETLKKIKDAATQMETYNQSGGGLFEDQNWKRLEAFIMDAGKGNTGAGQGPAFREPALTAASLAALNDAKVLGIQWAIKHPGASALERMQFISELSNQFLGSITNNGDQPVYNQPKAVTEARAAAFPDRATQGPTKDGKPPAGNVDPAMANPILPNGQTSTAPAVPQPKGWMQELSQYQDRAPKYSEMKGLSSEHRADIERIAKKTGHDAQWVLDTAWKNLKAISTGAQPTGEPKAAPAVPQAPIQQAPEGTPGTPAAPHAAMPSAPTGLVTGAVDAIRRMGSALIPAAKAAMPKAPGMSAETDAFPVKQASLSPEQMLAANAAEDGLDFARLRNGMVDAMGIDPVKGSIQMGEGLQAVSARRVAHIDAKPVGKLIDNVATKLGIDPSIAKAIADIESSGNPNAQTGSYKGLYQLSAAEFAKYGPKDGRSIMDPEANTIAGLRSLSDKYAKFEKEFGRKPSPAELYLMHQQGEAGLRAHASHPDRPAWESMLSTGEGQRKGARWAKLAIWGNVPSDMKAQFGSVENITSGQFIALWITKLQGVPFKKALAMIKQPGQRDA